jgi:glycosyltransferase involved in cell wall biosynthesis/O-antigen/teichoic acid export membrane protein
MGTPPRHILILTDRDWTHPQGGGTGTNLFGQVARWVAWGHRVTVVAGDYPGAQRVERPAPNLTIHRMGTRLTVFPRAAVAMLRGLGRDADVVLEVVNGIAFFTPLWLRRPRVALVHHVHRHHYVHEYGRVGSLAAWALETFPLRVLYSGTRFITISQAARRDLIATGVGEERIHVAYPGVEQSQFREPDPAPEPLLLYLGRLKQYKRIESLFSVMEQVPEATLLVAGHGDHRAALEDEIAERGLGDRVRLIGHVTEDEKRELFRRAWLTLTASSAEGWCLTVMEAAACGTPSAALRVGGLPESIVDGETGLLADTPEELAERVRDLIANPEERARLGAAAQHRAREFTWERTAQANLEVLDAELAAERTPLRESVARSETMKAAGLAAATLAANAIQLLFTVIFARLLGADDYGSLAALVSTFLILSVPGSALQVATARETALGRLGGPTHQAATVERWMRKLAVVLVGAIAASVILREPLATLIGVDEHPWAAAATIPTGCLWLALSIQRGALQGLHAYKPVGVSIIIESAGRLVLGLALVVAGMGITGAYLGSGLSMLVTAVVLGIVLRRRLGTPARGVPTRTLRDLIGGAWAPVAGLTLIAVLQNIDVIVVRHRVGGDAAGSYAAAAVAAKLVIWVAIGIAIYLLPEAARRAAAGLEVRPVLLRALAIVAAVSLPMLLIFAIAPHLLLRLAFGEKYTQAAGALVVLGAAMTLLAAAYLAVQYMLALGRFNFLYVLGGAAVLEPFLLSAGSRSLVGFAVVVLALQCFAATAVLVLGLRSRARLAL